jgi:tRNA threonylcarbamoyladenosine biosynthesis protein TsaE
MSHLPIVKTAVWPDEQATQAFASSLAELPALRDCLITLHGDLGAGKTTLVRHLLRACGVQGRIKSPTYALVEAYELADWSAWHFDFYRFEDPQEWEDAGFRDLFSSPGLKLAEWPQKVGDLLPCSDLEIHLQATDDAQRRVRLSANTDTGEALVKALHLQQNS